MQRKKTSTVTVMSQLGTSGSNFFEKAEKLREEAIVLAINQGTLQTSKIQRTLLSAKENYRSAIAAGDYRAICTPCGLAEVGALGGLYSLNDLLKRGGLWTEEDGMYFQQHFDAAVIAGDQNCLYLKRELEKRENYIELGSSIDDESSENDFSSSAEELPTPPIFRRR